MKKTAASLLALLLIVIMAVPMTASAVVVSLENGLALNPGNTRYRNPEYNFAWLDQLFVRTDTSAVIPAELTPAPTDYPYSHTYDDFIEECNRYIDLNSLDGKSINNIYSALIEMIYYSVVATGLIGDFDEMCTVLSNNGIDLPEEATKEDKIKIAVVYSVLEYNAIYALYGKETELPAGISLDAALTIILGALTNVNVPSGVDTTSGLIVQAVEQYLDDYDYVPLSDNPSAEELFYFLKVVIITENEENVPLDKFNELTPADKEYVDYKYFSTILEMAYDIPIDPEALFYANESEDSLAVHRVILGSMLEQKGITYSDADSTEKLFDLACKNEYFPLEKEFFSDVLNYRLEVAPSCEKIWFSPITLGDQLNGGDKTPITLHLQGESMNPGSTAAAALDTTKGEETVYLEVNYNDGNRQDTALYEFTIVKNIDLELSEKPSDALGHVESFVNSVVPTSNEKVSQAVEEIFNNIEESKPITDIPGYLQEVLSTYGETNPEDAVTSTTSAFTFDYLEQLMDEVYATDADGNIITTQTYSTTMEETTQPTETNFLIQVTQTVAENPEIIAAPTSLIALGGLLGFMMNKKHKDSLRFDNEEETEE